MTHPLRGRLSAVAIGITLAASLTGSQLASAHDNHARDHDRTTTPIKHVIIVVSENHTFANLFGT